MTRRTLLAIAALTAALPGWSAEPVRERRNFDDGWRFHLGEARGGEQPGLDDSGWRKLNLPHDWSIEGPHNSANASGTGYLPGGIGWYRKSFRLAEALSGRKIFIEFDGVYRDSDVWINGHLLGHRPSGYSSFEYDLTPYVNFGTRANLVAVRVDHSAAADSRFYTGSGIYRHVWLTVTEAVHVVRWGTYVYTPLVREAEALVSAETGVANESKAAAQIRLVTAIEDASGREVASVANRGGGGPWRGPHLRAAGHSGQAEAVVHGRSVPLYRRHAGVRGRNAGGRIPDAVRHPHDSLRRQPRVFSERQAGEAQGRVPASRPGGAGRGLFRSGAGTAAEAAEADRRQRHTVFAQPHGAGVVRPVRPAGAAGDGRGLRRVDGRQEEVDRRMERGRSGHARLPRSLRGMGHTRYRGHGAARPKPCIGGAVEHRQRNRLSGRSLRPPAGARWVEARNALRQRTASSRAPAHRGGQGPGWHAPRHRGAGRHAGFERHRPRQPAGCGRLQLPGAVLRAGPRDLSGARHFGQ